MARESSYLVQMSAIVPTFSAYPSSPTQVREVVERAVRNLKEKAGIEVVQSWRPTLHCGSFHSRSGVEQNKAFATDVTQHNFNEMYEVGYAPVSTK
jgi:hypothetical protein